MISKNKLSNEFLLIWFGQFISSIGNGLTAFALGIYVFEKTHSSISYAMILLAAFLPALILKPLGGTLADRMNRRLLMMIGDIGAAVGLLFIIVMMSLNIENLWVIYLGATISSIFVACQNPAYKAQVTDLVDEQQYAKASGFMQLAESAKFLISPIVAGFLLQVFTVLQVLMIDVMTFIVAIGTIYYVKMNHNVHQSNTDNGFFHDLVAGFTYLFAKQSILWLICIISFMTFFIGLFQALLGPMVLAFTNSQTLGIIQSVSLSGMIVGSLFIGFFGQFRQKISILSIGFILVGIFLAFVGTTTHCLLIIFFGFMLCLVLPSINAIMDVLVRTNVENQAQGRIWSIVSLVSQLGMAIAFGIAGFLADHVFNPFLESEGLLASTVGAVIGTGPGRGIGLIFILSGVCMIAVAIFISRLKKLKELEKPLSNLPLMNASSLE